MNIFFSTFTPSLMPSNMLEDVFVQRHDLASRLVDLTRDAACGGGKSHTLLIGPRGIGKTHLVSLVYHRAKALNLSDRLFIAWLREEEWGISSLRDLLMRILLQLADECQDDELKCKAEALYEREPDIVERLAGQMLKGYLGERTLLLIVENLDTVFDAIGEDGQLRLRAFIQENPFITILATAQSLFRGIQLHSSPFYGFFRIHHLEDLTFSEATDLLSRMAAVNGDVDLISFISTPQGRARVRAVYHLGGGNHRVYVILSQLLTRQKLDDLVDAVMKMIEDLTPYYQSRMIQLSPQQRRIVEFLCERGGAVTVKEIAQRCFATSQTISSTLKDLREMGYVRSDRLGRESYYELHEPLMRLCIEVKRHRGEPIRLFVDLLRIWYSSDDLAHRIASVGQGAIDRKYFAAALAAAQIDGPRLLLEACKADYDGYDKAGNLEEALRVAEEMIAICQNAEGYTRHGLSLIALDRWAQALVSFDKGVTLYPNNFRFWLCRAAVLVKLERFEEALASSNKATELAPKNALAWYIQGLALVSLKRNQEALDSFDIGLKLGPDPAISLVWGGRAKALIMLKRNVEALASLDKALELDPKDASAWYTRSLVLCLMHRYDEALATVDVATQLEGGFGKGASLCKSLCLASAGRWNDGMAWLAQLMTKTVDEDRLTEHADYGFLMGLIAARVTEEELVLRLSDLISLHKERQQLPMLSHAFIENTSVSIQDPDRSQAELKTWFAGWDRAAMDCPSLLLSLRLAKAAMRYKTEKDERILLDLPAEQRKVVRQMLGLEQSEPQDEHGTGNTGQKQDVPATDKQGEQG